LKDAFDKFKQNENNNESSHAIKDINDRLKSLDETIKGLPDQISSKSKRLDHDDEKTNMNNLRQVPLSQSIRQDSNNSMATPDGQIANLFTNLLTLQTAIQNSDHISYQDIQQYLKRIEQSSLVQTDRDLQGVCYAYKILINQLREFLCILVSTTCERFISK
jgi:prefoldin subunit 5